jgi:HlyD family secretion protein
MPLILKFVGILCLVAAIMAAAYYYPTWSAPRELMISGIVEIQEVHLGSKLGGRVSDVLVKEGEEVSPGQLLVQFEVPELEAQHQQQIARVASAEANLEKAKNGNRPEEIRQAKSDLESLEADLTLAEEDLKRVTKLFENQKLTRADYDSAVANRKRMVGRVAAAKAYYDLMYAGTRPEDIALAEANLLEARGKLKEIEANLAEAKVVAPERCLVEVVSVRKGDLVPPNQPVIRVLRADDLWIKAYVPETRLGEVRLQQPVTVTIDSYPGRTFHGMVYQISSESEFTPRNIQSADERRYQVFGVKIRVEDAEGIFKSGMSAMVAFESDGKRD